MHIKADTILLVKGGKVYFDVDGENIHINSKGKLRLPVSTFINFISDADNASEFTELLSYARAA